MSAIELVARLEGRGIRLALEDGRLAVDAPRGALGEEDRAALAAMRVEVVELLRHEAAVVAERVEAFARLVGPDLSVPFLFREGSPTVPGRCLSCGAEEPLQGDVRCDLCVRAAQVIVERVALQRNARVVIRDVPSQRSEEKSQKWSDSVEHKTWPVAREMSAGEVNP